MQAIFDRNLRWCKLKALLVLSTLLVVFSFTSQKVIVVFQCLAKRRTRRCDTSLSFKLSEFRFYNMFFVMLNELKKKIKSTI